MNTLATEYSNITTSECDTVTNYNQVLKFILSELSRRAKLGDKTAIDIIDQARKGLNV